MTGSGAVHLTVTCRTDPDPRAAGAEHAIALHPDGAIETPHDLPAERLAVALGGYLSCVELVDRVVPVLQEWLLLQQRAVPPPIVSRDSGRRWQPRERAACCPRGGYETPVAGADHARSAAHLATVRGVDQELLRALTQVLPTTDPPRPLGEAWDAAWACGIAASEVARISRVCGLDEPLGPGFYLAVLQHKPSLPWLREMLSAGPCAPATAEWLAWTYTAADRRDPRARKAWLSLGLPVRAIEGLIAADRRPEDVQHLAEHWAITRASAALLLLEWLDHGLPIRAADLTGPATTRLAYPPRPPGRRNVALLRQQLSAGHAATDVDAALAIIEHGSVGAALRAFAG